LLLRPEPSVRLALFDLDDVVDAVVDDAVDDAVDDVVADEVDSVVVDDGKVLESDANAAEPEDVR